MSECYALSDIVISPHLIYRVKWKEGLKVTNRLQKAWEEAVVA